MLQPSTFGLQPDYSEGTEEPARSGLKSRPVDGGPYLLIVNPAPTLPKNKNAGQMPGVSRPIYRGPASSGGQFSLLPWM